MEVREYDLMFLSEERHWWYRGMAHITRRLIQRYYPEGTDLHLLDTGCGTGGAAESYLSLFGEVTCIDISAQAIRYCRKRNLSRLVRASILSLPFPDSAFDIAASFDVLYFCGAEDVMGLREMLRVLKPGGRLFLRLPAYAWMRRKHDDSAHITHRYTLRETLEKLRSAGFFPEHGSYANMLLFPAAVARALLDRMQPSSAIRSGLEDDFGRWNPALQAILASEAPLVAGPGLPFGLSVTAVGRKPA